MTLSIDLLSRYQTAVTERGLVDDPVQVRTIVVLDRIARDLAARESPPGMLARMRRRLAGSAPESAVRGAYLWGGVGRGKTLMMDLFFESLPIQAKARHHFHRIMRLVHARLAAVKDQPDPLAIVAQEMADGARVICFDEFQVTDIADAMILGRLLEALFERGVTLVATSNTAPEDLYRGGLQRPRFLPAIEALRHNTEVVHVDGLTDYRLRVLESAEIWHAPLDRTADENLVRYFVDIAGESGAADVSIDVLGRELPSRRLAEGVVWFDFAALCGTARSADDYIEIASSFHSVIVSGVPVLDELAENEARRFVALVDEFYDRRVNLIVSAAAPIGQIYRGARLAREFERTRSRLLEMQSVEYLAAEHLA